jgi:hypothetical protein
VTPVSQGDKKEKRKACMRKWNEKNKEYKCNWTLKKMQETMIKLCDDGDTAQQGKGDAKRVEEEGIDYVEIENVEVITMEDSFDFQNEQTDSGITTTKDNHDMVSDNNNVLLVKSTRTQNPEGRWGRWVRDKGPPLLIRDHRGLAIASAATASAASAAAPGVTLLSHPFGPGLGCLYVAPDLISTATHKEITQEIRSLGGRERFRIYPIQGEWEPRTHFLLHAEAKMDTNTRVFDTTMPQPGYGYGRGARSLKARPLNDFPLAAKLAGTVDEMARHHDISSTKTASTMETYWNIGANVVCRQ